MIIAAKTTSTVLVHLTVAVAVGYVLTGSLAVAGLVALVEPVCNVVVLHFHEKVWARVMKPSPTSWERVARSAG